MAIVVAMSAMAVPGMSAAIGGIEYGTSEVEEVAVRITDIDAEMPETVTPRQWTEKIAGGTEGIPLPVQQDIAQVAVATLPVVAVNIVDTGHSHQVVEVDFVGSLILFVSEIQLIRHLVRQEQGFVSCLLVSHCLACSY